MAPRYARVAIVAAVVGLAVSAGSADARTIRVDWTDTQPLGGGRVIYRTTKIWVHGDRFSVDVTITNRTKYDIRFFPATGPDDPAYIPIPGFGIAWREPLAKGTTSTRRLRTVVPRSFSRSIPLRLNAGKTTNLTFSGRSRLLRMHRTWWITFGIVVPWKGKRPAGDLRYDLRYWISEKTFST